MTFVRTNLEHSYEYRPTRIRVLVTIVTNFYSLWVGIFIRSESDSLTPPKLGGQMKSLLRILRQDFYLYHLNRPGILIFLDANMHHVHIAVIAQASVNH